MKKILVVVVLYHPEEANLITLIKNCLCQKNLDIFVSDNGGVDKSLKNEITKIDVRRVIYHNNQENLGVAGAQNKGLNFALEKQYDYVVLFDQDSTIDNSFILHLAEAFENARAKDPKIIAAGPSFIDPRYIGKRARKKVVKHNQYKNMLIASGCIISLPELKDVGVMDESLFIDHVDTEWCYRAKSKGYRVIQLGDAVMNHTIGEIKKTWWGYQLQYHHENRYYYLFRNSVKLFSRKYIPLKNRIYILLRCFLYVLKIPFLDRPFVRLKLAAKGVREGTRGGVI